MSKSDFIKGLYPSQNKLFLTTTVAVFEYLLEEGKDAVCQMLIDGEADLSFSPNVQNRVREYQTHSKNMNF